MYVYHLPATCLFVYLPATRYLVQLAILFLVSVTNDLSVNNNPECCVMYHMMMVGVLTVQRRVVAQVYSDRAAIAHSLTRESIRAKRLATVSLKGRRPYKLPRRKYRITSYHTVVNVLAAIERAFSSFLLLLSDCIAVFQQHGSQ
jgi:hypothetical protein